MLRCFDVVRDSHTDMQTTPLLIEQILPPNKMKETMTTHQYTSIMNA